MMKLTMMKGLPASGKSTRAKEIQAIVGNTKIVSNDALRDMLDDGKWSSKNEKFMLKIRDKIIITALEDGKNIIVDACHLAPEHEEHLSELAYIHGAWFEVEDFTRVSPQECVKRDLQRARSVGSDVIYRMYYQFIFSPESIPYNEKLPSCIIVDIDGTLAHMKNRGPFDWSRVGEDSINFAVLHLLNAVKTSTRIILVSGRDAVCREQTEQWLTRYEVPYDKLFMRPQNDVRKDVQIKREIFENEIRGKYNVVFAIDDRPQVIRGLWEPLGIAVYNVGRGYEF